MPNKIPLEEIKKMLPPFVSIVDETYKGKRYVAQFIDTEYGELFVAIVEQVIRLQHGCKKRADKRKSLTLKGRDTRATTSLDQVKSKLPPYLTIDESTYKGVRHKATFHDTEYGESFERLVCNVIREGRGYCASREADEFKKKISVSKESIAARLDALYGGRVKILDDYIDTNTPCTFLIDGQKKKIGASYALAGKVFIRRALERWRAVVLVRDSFLCQKCDCSAEKLCAHHILRFSQHKAQRFNVNNGITLCGGCHDEYHARFKGIESPANFCGWIGEEKGRLVTDRLAAPVEIPNGCLASGQ